MLHLLVLAALLWNGYPREDFHCDGRAAILVEPKAAAPGRPWIWRTEFFGAFAQADTALLGKGYAVAYLNVQNMYGAPVALEHMDRFYATLVQGRGLSPLPVLEGFSRGGLFAFNWAARHPERVGALYVDAPVCDIKSWPGGRMKGTGSKTDWERCKQAYGFASDEQALAFRGNPVDELAPIAAAHIPIIAVCGEADVTVPPAENINIVERRYQALGGRIAVIRKPGAAHRPHSLPDPTPIVDFLLKYALVKEGRG